MNKRQKKKAYKKKYGSNPINTKATVEIDWDDIVKEVASLGYKTGKTLEYISRGIMTSMVNRIEIVLKETEDVIHETIVKVKNMSDEEWETFKKDLDSSQIAILEKED